MNTDTKEKKPSKENNPNFVTELKILDHIQKMSFRIEALIRSQNQMNDILQNHFNDISRMFKERAQSTERMGWIVGTILVLSTLGLCLSAYKEEIKALFAGV